MPARMEDEVEKLKKKERGKLCLMQNIVWAHGPTNKKQQKNCIGEEGCIYLSFYGTHHITPCDHDYHCLRRPTTINWSLQCRPSHGHVGPSLLPPFFTTMASRCRHPLSCSLPLCTAHLCVAHSRRPDPRRIQPDLGITNSKARVDDSDTREGGGRGRMGQAVLRDMRRRTGEVAWSCDDDDHTNIEEN